MFYLADTQRQQMLYISPAYDHIWQRDHQALLDEACQIAVGIGGFSCAFILDVDAAQTALRLRSACGLNAAEMAMLDRLAATELQQEHSLLARSCHEQLPQYSNDCTREPSDRLCLAALERNNPALICLPILLEQQCAAVLVLFASARDVFDTEELKLLGELGADISLALHIIRKDERLNYLAFYDPLTGLANRQLFLDRLHQSLASARQDHGRVCVYLLNINHFKQINDQYGYHVGDELLRQFAQRWRSALPESSNLARISADVFALATGVASTDASALVREHIRDAFRRYRPLSEVSA